jgi:hypothetical protein
MCSIKGLNLVVSQRRQARCKQKFRIRFRDANSKFWRIFFFTKMLVKNNFFSGKFFDKNFLKLFSFLKKIWAMNFLVDFFVCWENLFLAIFKPILR